MKKQIWWMCNRCDHVLKAEKPPEKCPHCKKTSLFSYIDRYVPETAPQYSEATASEIQLLLELIYADGKAKSGSTRLSYQPVFISSR